jgi:hypothetical protein
VELRAGTDVSEMGNVFNQAVGFRRLPYSVTRGRLVLISQINARVHDVTFQNMITFTITAFSCSNFDSFAQVNGFSFWRVSMSSGPSDFLADNLGNFSGFSHVNAGLVPSNCA